MMSISNSMMTFSNASLNRVVSVVGGWKELGRTTLGSPTSTIDLSSIPDKRYYQVLVNYAASIDSHIRFNGVSTTTYAQRRSDDGSESSNVNQDKIAMQAGAAGTNVRFTTGYIANLSSKEKFAQFWTNIQSTVGAGTAPSRTDAVGKHAQTSNPIDQMTIVNTGGNFPTGAELVVLGWDPADTHTTNFWEELASVELGSSGDTIDSGTITAKKYLWIQCWTKSTGGTTNGALRFNSDSLTNYAFRESVNGGADATATGSTSAGFLIGAGTDVNPKFGNAFVINNSANEKLAIIHSLQANSTGSANVPARRETVSKWNNTASPITSVQVVNTSTGDLDTGSILKVWGSN